MRKSLWLSLVLAVLLLNAGLLTVFAHGEADHGETAAGAEGEGIEVTVDGVKVNGYATMNEDMTGLRVPVRAVAEALGASVIWDENRHIVLINTHTVPEHLDIHDMTDTVPAHDAYPIHMIVQDHEASPGVEPLYEHGVITALADAYAREFQARAKWVPERNEVQILTPAAAGEFEEGTSASNAVFQGIGLAPQSANGDVKEFTLTAEMHPWSPVRGVMINAWTFNGQVPGPTIRVTEGDKVRIKVVNNLPEATTVHWHGLHVPPGMDGVPGISQPPVKPGETFTYEFTASHPGTFMYHSHYDDMKQVASGMYGAFIIDPKESGKSAVKYDHDYTMVLSGLHVNTAPDEEADYYAINGRSYPDTLPILAKKGETVRVRLINIDTMEVHTMHLHGLDFQVIAKDGHPVLYPQTMNTVLIGPGETYDIAFSADTAGEWMFHCHILDHTMNGEQHSPGEMGGLITVVKVTE